MSRERETIVRGGHPLIYAALIPAILMMVFLIGTDSEIPPLVKIVGIFIFVAVGVLLAFKVPFSYRIEVSEKEDKFIFKRTLLGLPFTTKILPLSGITGMLVEDDGEWVGSLFLLIRTKKVKLCSMYIEDITEIAGALSRHLGLES